MTNWTPTIENCNNYMNERTGKYEYRAIRYRAAIDSMIENGMNEFDTVYDVGAGRTEFARTLYSEYDFKGMYIPVDGGIDGVNLNGWIPPRRADWFVALELVEHLWSWPVMVDWMKEKADKGVILSTPNPRTTDVLGMDPTHVCEVQPEELEVKGFKVREETFYGGIWSNGEPDSLFGVWTRD